MIPTAMINGRINDPNQYPLALGRDEKLITGWLTRAHTWRSRGRLRPIHWQPPAIAPSPCPTAATTRANGNAAVAAAHEMQTTAGDQILGSVSIGRHATMTPAMRVQGAYLQCFICFLTVALGVVKPVAAQALHVSQLANGSELLVVAQPLADATTVVWPSPTEGDEQWVVVTSGDLTLIADLESRLGGDEFAPAPAIVIAVGGASVPDLGAFLDRVFAARPPAMKPEPRRNAVVEGRFERRLGAPGSEAELRLEVLLPSASATERSSVEVLWDLLPELLDEGLEGVRSRVDGDRALLEARTDSENADVALRQLRISLASIAGEPDLKPAQVEASRRRLQVRRQAFLERHPDAAERLLELWISGGADAVREFLFAVDGVTVDGVREAARRWLPRHPGNVVLVLPPRTFNPRFAAPPRVVQLDNGLSAAILERSGPQLATLCVRPVVVPDFDHEAAATVLSRLAREIRDDEERPGWVWVSAQPAQLELALPAEEFAQLGEVLQSALGRVTDDTLPVMAEGGNARRRALRLMAGLLGIADGSTMSPATLLRTGNLALGVVAEDGEAAAEAVQKFWASDGSFDGGATASAVVPVPRTRQAAPGDKSVMVVGLELAVASGEVLELAVADLLAQRSEALLPEGTIEILSPFVPGHRVLLLVASASGSLDSVEARLKEGWEALTSPVTEQELVEIRRRVAADAAARWSGATGQARRCAAVAAGAARWRPSAELEMSALSVPVEMVNVILAGFSVWENQRNTGAGILPIIEVDDR